MDISRRALVLSLALVAPVVLAQTPWSRPSQTASSNAIQAEAWQIVQLANQARAQAGAGPLQWDAALATAARQHCLRMAADSSISHQYPGEPDVSAARRAGRRPLQPDRRECGDCPHSRRRFTTRGCTRPATAPTC